MFMFLTPVGYFFNLKNDFGLFDFSVQRRPHEKLGPRKNAPHGDS